MIIQRRGPDLLFIRQCDHAALAASIIAHWMAGGLADSARRETILAATREHDNGWQEEDALMHVGADGDPLDFMTVGGEVKRRIWPRAVARLASADPYLAALVAEHALTIYAHFADDPAWSPFFRAITRARDELLARAAPADAAAAARDYTFLRVGDLLSLIFCNGWTAPHSAAGWQAILRGVTLQVAPDPFGGRRVPLRIDARVLAARPYRSREDLQQAFRAAPIIALAGEAVGA